MSPEAPTRAILERLRGPAALILLASDAVLLIDYLVSAFSNASVAGGAATGMYIASDRFLSLSTLALPLLAVVLVAVVRPALPSAVPGVLLAATAELAAALFLGVIALLWGFAAPGISASDGVIRFFEIAAWAAVFGIALFALVRVLPATRPPRGTASYGPGAPEGYPQPGAGPGQQAQWPGQVPWPGQPGQPGPEQPVGGQYGQPGPGQPVPGQYPHPGQPASAQYAQPGPGQYSPPPPPGQYGQPAPGYQGPGGYPPPPPPTAPPAPADVDTGAPPAQATTFLRASDVIPAPSEPHSDQAILSGPGSTTPPAQRSATPEPERTAQPPGIADNEPEPDENDAATRALRWPPEGGPPTR